MWFCLKPRAIYQMGGMHPLFHRRKKGAAQRAASSRQRLQKRPSASKKKRVTPMAKARPLSLPRMPLILVGKSPSLRRSLRSSPTKNQAKRRFFRWLLTSVQVVILEIRTFLAPRTCPEQKRCQKAMKKWTPPRTTSSKITLVRAHCRGIRAQVKAPPW